MYVLIMYITYMYNSTIHNTSHTSSYLWDWYIYLHKPGIP